MIQRKLFNILLSQNKRKKEKYKNVHDEEK